MKSYNQQVLLLVCLTLLAGCSHLAGDNGYFQDRDDDYLEAQLSPPIIVPENLDSAAIIDLYVIPQSSSDDVLSSGGYEVPRPAPLLSDGTGEAVRIQKLGTQQWILLNATPSQIWPQLRHFLFTNKNGLGEENGGKGVLETQWLSVDEDAQLREKFRFQVEQGVQRNSSEIHIRQADRTHLSVMDNPLVDWPNNSMNISRESWMVKELANYLASSIGGASVSLIAQGISTASKLTVAKTDDGYVVIRIQLPYDRAWASVGNALKKAEFRVDDKDRSRGEYIASYWPQPTEEDQPGFWGNLFGRGQPEYADVMFAGEQYRVSVTETSEGAEIRFYQEGDDYSAAEAESLIALIKGYLT